METFVTHTLRGGGFDASEDGTGRGTPLVPVPVIPIQEIGKRTGKSSTSTKAGDGFGNAGDPMFSLGTDSRHGVAAPVAFAENSRAELRLEGGDGQTVSALKTGGGKPGQSYPAIVTPIDMRQASRGATMTNNRSDGVASGGAPGTGIGEPGDPSPSLGLSHLPAIAFHGRQDPDVAGDKTHPLDTDGHSVAVAVGDAQPVMTVRRLLPVECEKLQGFSPGYTDIDVRGKPAADGPRYRALGNSMAVPVMRYIGEQIVRVISKD